MGIQYAALVKQFFENTFKGSRSLFRDQAMAENISRFKNERFPNAKIMVWAQEVHISRSDHSEVMYNLNYGL